MNGLPFTVSHDDIEQFFHGFGMIEDSIKIGKHPDGRSTGQAVVAFQSAEDASQAHTERYKNYIGSRFIELFSISDLEYKNFDRNNFNQ
jgi:hypothetical protein